MRHTVYVILALVLIACGPQNEEKSQVNSDISNIYIGTYTQGESEGVYSAQFDSKSGKLSNLELVSNSENPSFLALIDDDKLVAVNEIDPGMITLFDLTSKTIIQDLPTDGIHPCHVSVNEELGLVSIANYSSGSLTFMRYNEGKLSLEKTFQHYGSGPNLDRQEAPHAHFSTFSKDGSLMFACDLGIDRVMAYPLANLDSGFVAWEAQPADGPRHLDFHPTKNLVFVLNELSNTVNSFSLQPEGTFEVIDRASTLPEDFQDFSKAADIHVSPNGRFLYVSNRGYDSIAIYEISDDGSLTRLGFATEKIQTPRNFTLDPTGRWLLVANQDGNNIISFQVQENGLLKPTNYSIEVGNPVCVVFP